MVLADGTVVSAGDALLHLLALLPGSRRAVAPLVERPRAQRIAEIAYQAVSRRRGALARFVSDVPPPRRPPRV